MILLSLLENHDVLLILCLMQKNADWMEEQMCVGWPVYLIVQSVAVESIRSRLLELHGRLMLIVPLNPFTVRQTDR